MCRALIGNNIGARTEKTSNVWETASNLRHIADHNHDDLRPQATGNTIDVRWREVRQAAIERPRITGDLPLVMNALAFPDEDLSPRAPGTRRSSDIMSDAHDTVRIDAVRSGVGGNPDWDATAAYQIPPAKRSFGFVLCPFSGDGTTLAAAPLVSTTVVQ